MLLFISISSANALGIGISPPEISANCSEGTICSLQLRVFNPNSEAIAVNAELEKHNAWLNSKGAEVEPFSSKLCQITLVPNQTGLIEDRLILKTAGGNLDAAVGVAIKLKVKQKEKVATGVLVTGSIVLVGLGCMGAIRIVKVPKGNKS